ncbi:hypothetical protein L1887_46111 [Cichorium endivia]|nr:hypothetical protein L1887_46111 [Cichorium endivia]
MMVAGMQAQRRGCDAASSPPQNSAAGSHPLWLQIRQLLQGPRHAQPTGGKAQNRWKLIARRQPLSIDFHASDRLGPTFARACLRDHKAGFGASSCESGSRCRCASHEAESLQIARSIAHPDLARPSAFVICQLGGCPVRLRNPVEIHNIALACLMWILRGPEISLFGFFSEVGRKIQDFSSRICDRGTRIIRSTVQRCEERRTIPERSSDDKASNYDSRVSGRGVRSGGGRGSTQHALLMPDGWYAVAGAVDAGAVVAGLNAPVAKVEAICTACLLVVGCSVLDLLGCLEMLAANHPPESPVSNDIPVLSLQEQSLRFHLTIHTSCHQLPGLKLIVWHAVRLDSSVGINSASQPQSNTGCLACMQSRPSKLMTPAGDSKPTSMPSGPAVAFERARFRSFDMMRHVLGVAIELL